MSHIATAHGIDWEIECSDWRDSRDADRCAARIGEKIAALPAPLVRQAVAEFRAAAAAGGDAYDRFVNGYGTPGRAFDCIETACCEAKREIMDGYLAPPSSGHNAAAYPC